MSCIDWKKKKRRLHDQVMTYILQDANQILYSHDIKPTSHTQMQLKKDF